MSDNSQVSRPGDTDERERGEGVRGGGGVITRDRKEVSERVKPGVGSCAG